MAELMAPIKALFAMPVENSIPDWKYSMVPGYGGARAGMQSGIEGSEVHEDYGRVRRNGAGGGAREGNKVSHRAPTSPSHVWFGPNLMFNIPLSFPVTSHLQRVRWFW